MRLHNFAKQNPAVRSAGLRKGGVIDRIVWEEFVGDRTGLEVEVSGIRRSAYSGDLRSPARNSRMPMPAFGVRSGLTDRWAACDASTVNQPSRRFQPCKVRLDQGPRAQNRGIVLRRAAEFVDQVPSSCNAHVSKQQTRA